MSAARPVYIGGGPKTVFGLFHPPAAGAPDRRPVVICPPWGWDEVAGYRSRRRWAESLAAAGHPTLRIDLPGAGDSAGDPADAHLVEAWTEGLTAATRWLAGATGTSGVAVIGLGLSGLVAARARAAGAPIEELALWATPTSGRTFLREQRAFGSMQRSLYGVEGDAGTDLPEGWQEIGGYVLSAETAKDISEIDLMTLDLGGLRRVLILERDGLPADKKLVAHLRAVGLDVTVQPGDGWGAMHFHPERPAPPLDVFARVERWLDAGAPATQAPDGAAQAQSGAIGADHLDLVVDGTAVRESAIRGAQGSFFGIVAEPVDRGAAGLCAVFLNAGAVRRTGPNRMWVEGARRWAARGIPTVRVDGEAIGDADGDETMYTDVDQFYTPNRGAQVTAVLDALEARGLGPRFVIIGLCSGAYSGFTIAPDDHRIQSVVAINPRVLIWDPDILRQRDAQDIALVLDRAAWRRVLSGETSMGRVLQIARAAAVECSRMVQRGARALVGRRETPAWAGEMEKRLDQLAATNTRLVLAFSGDEPEQVELDEIGVFDRAATWPNLALRELPGHDHTLRPIAAQRAFHELVDAELEHARAGGAPAKARRAASTTAKRTPKPELQAAKR